MKSASKNWILFFITLFFLSCGSNKPQPISKVAPKMQKAYVLLRSEGSVAEVAQLKNILNSDFVTNNVASKIVSYPLKSSWNTNQIFSTAYNEDYDYIVLIDQVAKFTIDQRTQVGGKYQIRSYHLKSQNPDWLDLGQLTCNVTVKPSIQKFTSQIVSNIVPNYKPSVIFKDEDVYASNSSSATSFKSSGDVEKEIKELKRQLEIEKRKTEEALAEKKRLESEYEKMLAEQKEKKQKALVNLELAKIKEEEALALEEAKKLKEEKEKAERQEKERLAQIAKEEAKKKKEQEDLALAEAKRLKEEKEKAERQEKERLAQIEKEEAKRKQEQEALALKEAKRFKTEKKKVKLPKEEKRLEQERKEQEKFELKEKERLAKLEAKKDSDKKSSLEKKTKKNKSNSKEKQNRKTKVLVILRVKNDDFDNIKKLEYNIEFDFLFAKAEAVTKIIDKNSAEFDKNELTKKHKNNFSSVIIVNQLNYIGDSFSNYQISSCKLSEEINWKESSIQSYDLSNSDSVKALSKSIASNL